MARGGVAGTGGRRGGGSPGRAGTRRTRPGRRRSPECRAALAHLGTLTARLKEGDDAKRFFFEALKRAERIDYGKGIGTSLLGLGDLTLEETADVRGSAVCFGGDIQRNPGAKIGDQEVSLGNFPISIPWGPWIGRHGVGPMISRGIGTFAGIVLLGIVLLLGAGLIFFFPRAVDRVSSVIGGGIVKSGLVGLLGEVMVLPVFLIVGLILCVSIIGIPLLFLVIPLGVLGLVAALFMGYIGAGLFVGRKIGERGSLQFSGSAYKAMIFGVIALLVFDILASVAGLTGGILWPIETFFKSVGCIVTYLAVTIGFGAVILTRFGTRPAAVEKAGAE